MKYFSNRHHARGSYSERTKAEYRWEGSISDEHADGAALLVTAVVKGIIRWGGDEYSGGEVATIIMERGQKTKWFRQLPFCPPLSGSPPAGATLPMGFMRGLLLCVIVAVVLPFLVVSVMSGSWLPPSLLLVVAVGSWSILQVVNPPIPELVIPFSVLVGLVALSTRRLIFALDENTRLSQRTRLWLLFVVLVGGIALLFTVAMVTLAEFFEALGGPEVIIAVGVLVGLVTFAIPRRWMLLKLP